MCQLERVPLEIQHCLLVLAHAVELLVGIRLEHRRDPVRPACQGLERPSLELERAPIAVLAEEPRPVGLPELQPTGSDRVAGLDIEDLICHGHHHERAVGERRRAPFNRHRGIDLA